MFPLHRSILLFFSDLGGIGTMSVMKILTLCRPLIFINQLRILHSWDGLFVKSKLRFSFFLFTLLTKCDECLRDGMWLESPPPLPSPPLAHPRHAPVLSLIHSSGIANTQTKHGNRDSTTNTEMFKFWSLISRIIFLHSQNLCITT